VLAVFAIFAGLAGAGSRAGGAAVIGCYERVTG